MPAYTRPGALVVSFQRYGQQPDELTALDGIDAVGVATQMLLARISLEPGDRLTIRKTDPAELPAVSHASHFSGAE
jgi:hypothetical protein